MHLPHDLPMTSLQLSSKSLFPLTCTTWSTARLIPRRRSMGFIPAATDLHPSLKMARVRTVAVVVPTDKRRIVEAMQR